MNRSTRRQIPSFSLYGERAPARHTDPLHIEGIQSRSRKYLWKIASHRHVGLCQCVYVTAGPVRVELEGAREQLVGPTFIVIPAGAVHGFGFQADSEGFVLTLDLDRLLTHASPAHRVPIVSLFSAPRMRGCAGDPAAAARLRQLFDALLLEFRQPDSLLAPVSSWLGCAILWTLSSAFTPLPESVALEPDLDMLRQLRRHIEAHFLEHWPVRRYAHELAVSESSLNRVCLSLAGCTAFEIIQQRLALEARRRLLFVAGPVSMIAAELGFKDPAYFCRFFRKRNGMSPAAFRSRGDG